MVGCVATGHQRALQEGATAADSQLPAIVTPALSSRGAWKRLVCFLAVAALALGGVVAVSRAMPAPARTPFDQETLHRLRKRQPDFVLLGNSMVHSRFHKEELGRLLNPYKVEVLGVPGSKTAAWYLMLKNQILAAGRPKRVLIFFYGEELTMPGARATGGEAWRIERVSPTDDPVVVGKLAPQWSDPVARLSWKLHRLVPTERIRSTTDGPVRAWASHVSSWLQPAADASARDAAINGLFELDALRNTGPQPESTPPGSLLSRARGERSFAERVERSFLPDILALAREAGVPLILLHIRERATAEGQPLPPEYVQYLKQIEQYLRAQNVRYIDMSPNEWESASFYGEDSHLKHHVRRKYTRLFVRHMGSVFE